MKFMLLRRLVIALFLFNLIGAVAAGQPASTASVRASDHGFLVDQSGVVNDRLKLISVTGTSLRLEWIAPETQVGIDDKGYLDVQIAGLEQAGEAGEIRLPVDAYLLALPFGAQARLEIISSDFEDQVLDAPLRRNPVPEGIILDDKGRPAGGNWSLGDISNAFPRDAKNVLPVYLEEEGAMRGVRLVRLTFSPVVPTSGQLRLFQRFQININWDIEAVGMSGKENDPLLALLQKQVINPWMISPDADQPQAMDSTASQQAGIYLEIDHPGAYRVGYQDLLPYGLTSQDPKYLRLFRGTQEAAYFWEGDGDDTFEQNESLLFYADRRFSRWTELDVLHLVSDPNQAGKRMVTRNVMPTGPAGVPTVEILAEDNLIYTPDCFCKALPGRDGDRWVWKKLAQPEQSQVVLSFNAPAVSSGLPAELTLWFISYSESKNIDQDHRVDVALNGYSLGSVIWDGKQAINHVLAIPPAVLLSGVNTLTLTLPLNIANYYDQLWLDAFRVRYARTDAASGQVVKFQAETGSTKAYTIGMPASTSYFAFDVTDPLNPQRLVDFVIDNGYRISLAGTSGGYYWLTSGASITTPNSIRPAADPWLYQAGGAPGGADYVIITHPAFASSLQPLIQLRSGEGYSVAVANVLGIYDSWGDGRIDPEAIRAFLSQAYSSWQPKPAFVLLVGDGSSDPRQYLAVETTFIPPYLADVDPWAGETAADNRYVAVSGTDSIPDMLLGRLPVQTLSQAQAVVAKIVQYEADSMPSAWNSNILMVSDDRDPAGNFADLNSKSSALVVSPFRTINLACADQDIFPYFYDNCEAAKAQQIHASLLNLWPTGPFLVQYTGHSSWQQWASERYFHLEDLPDLQTKRQPTIVLEMTCFTGAFQRPEPTLDESLVVLPGAGAVASWGSTGLGVSTGHDRLSQGFFESVFQGSAATLGEATLAGKLALIFHLDLLDTFNLLGDPALGLDRQALPWSSQVFLPLVTR